MKKNIEKILKSVTSETPVKDVLEYCDTAEDFECIISSLTKTDGKPVSLSEELKQAALSLVKTNKLNAARITTSYIQRNLPVTYPQAAAFVDWLRTFL